MATAMGRQLWFPRQCRPSPLDSGRKADPAVSRGHYWLDVRSEGIETISIHKQDLTGLRSSVSSFFQIFLHSPIWTWKTSVFSASDLTWTVAILRRWTFSIHCNSVNYTMDMHLIFRAVNVAMSLGSLPMFTNIQSFLSSCKWQSKNTQDIYFVYICKHTMGYQCHLI